eukprot:Filipodium_phascolosomae@DN2751_c0_g1_i26.p1
MKSFLNSSKIMLNRITAPISTRKLLAVFLVVLLAGQDYVHAQDQFLTRRLALSDADFVADTSFPVKNGQTNHLLTFEFISSQDPAKDLEISIPTGFAFSKPDCKEDLTVTAPALKYPVATCSHAGQKATITATLPASHATNKFQVGVKVNVPLLPATVITEEFKVGYTLETAQTVAVGKVQVISGSASAAAAGGHAKWAVIKPTEMTVGTTASLSVFLNLATPIASAGAANTRSLYIELPTELALPAVACNHADFDLSVKGCDGASCTEITVDATGGTSVSLKCAIDGTQGLKLVATGLVVATNNLKVTFKAAATAVGNDLKATIVSFKTETPSAKNHAAYLTDGNAVGYGETKPEFKVSPPLKLKSGFPMKPGVSAPTTRMELSFKIITAASANSSMVVKLPAGYAVTTCDIDTTDSGEYKGLTVTSCTMNAAETTLVISGTPSDATKEFYLGLKVSTPMKPPTTDNRFEVKYATYAALTASAANQLLAVTGSEANGANGGSTNDAVMRPVSMAPSTLVAAKFHFTLTSKVATSGGMLVAAPTGFTVPNDVCSNASVRACTTTTCTEETVGSTGEAWECTKEDTKAVRLERKAATASNKAYNVEFKVTTPTQTGSAGKASILTCTAVASCTDVKHSAYLANADLVDFGETNDDVRITTNPSTPTPTPTPTAPPTGGVIKEFGITSGERAKPTQKNHRVEMSFKVTGSMPQNSQFTLELPDGFSYPSSDCQATPPTGGLSISKCTVNGQTGTFKLGQAVATGSTAALGFATNINVVQFPAGNMLKLKYGSTTLTIEMTVQTVKGSQAAKDNAKGDAERALMLPVNVTQNKENKLEFIFTLTTPITQDAKSVLIELPTNFTMAEKDCTDDSVGAQLENCGSTCVTEKVAAKAGGDAKWVCTRLGKTGMRFSRSATTTTLQTVRVTLKAISPASPKRVAIGPASIYSCDTNDCELPKTKSEYLSMAKYVDFGETKNVNFNNAKSLSVVSAIAIALLSLLSS